MALALFAEEIPFMGSPEYLLRLNDIINDAGSGAFPFTPEDTTAGVENEFQTVVEGPASGCDLPLTISSSKYYNSLLKRLKSGEISKSAISGIEDYIDSNTSNVWENSWVRIDVARLGEHARKVLVLDLKSQRSNPLSPMRADTGKFLINENGLEILRIPVSYMLKLCLADAAWASDEDSPARCLGLEAMSCFINDNTSPEVSSFSPVKLVSGPVPCAPSANETLLRFLLIQSLAAYANTAYGLKESGQEVKVYFSPHPPVRQKKLNDTVSDYFYRELFMNPCLSGWENGEEKYAYMHLCHKVLSSSQLTAANKLKDAGIINNGLVVLPNLSNISLANNGTHVSLGSNLLTGLVDDASSGFFSQDEKYIGDLVIKIVEHFLPLFVATYTADPYRLSFSDFHPEKALGFLPHELDFTHLRMLWRRWKKKANLKFFGKIITPLGPKWLDGILGSIPGLEGDYVDDFRLIDYLVCLLSTDDAPAMNGLEGNDERLKTELEMQGVFDKKMSLYLFYRQRRSLINGFSGFEGRHYSQFASLLDDMSHAVSLQCLLTSLAMRYVLSGMVTHDDIPDSPFVESERRQIFFGAAIGIPTFFVKKDTQNRFLLSIVSGAKKTRSSARYSGYIRVHNVEYLKSLLNIMKRDAPDLIEQSGMNETIRDLTNRIENPFMCSCASRLKNGILQSAGVLSPFELKADEFNQAAEEYYKNRLRLQHIDEAVQVMEKSFLKMQRNPEYRESLNMLFKVSSWPVFLSSARDNLHKQGYNHEPYIKIIHTILHIIEYERRESKT